jgi:hypothetical protein
MRQPTVRRTGRSECRLDELLGRSFAVLGRKQSDLRLNAESRSLLAGEAGYLGTLHDLWSHRVPAPACIRDLGATAHFPAGPLAGC